MATGTDTASSDIDLLVYLDLNLGCFYYDMQNLLKGQKIDIVKCLE